MKHFVAEDIWSNNVEHLPDSPLAPSKKINHTLLENKTKMKNIKFPP